MRSMIATVLGFTILFGFFGDHKLGYAAGKATQKTKSQSLNKISNQAMSKQKPNTRKRRKVKLSIKEMKILAARKALRLRREVATKKRCQRLRNFHRTLRQQNAAIQAQLRAYRAKQQVKFSVKK